MSALGVRLICKSCGATGDGPQGDPTDIAPSEHCGKCPPWTCDECRQLSDARNPCSCWISLQGMALADIKGLLALGDLSVTRVIPPGGGRA